MDSKLIDVWQASAGNPFLPTVGKGTQFLVAFVLLLLGLFSFGIFALSKKETISSNCIHACCTQAYNSLFQTVLQSTCPSLEFQLLWPSRMSASSSSPSRTEVRLLSNDASQSGNRLHVLCGRRLRLRSQTFRDTQARPGEAVAGGVVSNTID